MKICDIQLADSQPGLSINNGMPGSEGEGTDNFVTGKCSTQMEAVG